MIIIGVCFIFCDNKALDIFMTNRVSEPASRAKSISDAHREIIPNNVF
jgi:hypothetical protein